MSSKIFVNLPVKDLKRSMAFYTAIGFTNNPQFTDHTAACMIFSEEIYVMLLTHEKFSQFTKKQIADASKTAQMSIALLMDSKDGVHKIAESAVAAGGVEPSPMSDYGFMIQRTFEDLDGHTWAPFFMDPAHVQK
jgi:uncharacterized protein